MKSAIRKRRKKEKKMMNRHFGSYLKPKKKKKTNCNVNTPPNQFTLTDTNIKKKGVITTGNCFAYIPTLIKPREKEVLG